MTDYLALTTMIVRQSSVLGVHAVLEKIAPHIQQLSKISARGLSVLATVSVQP